MCSGRKESVDRHIQNPRIHNGRAIPIPYVEYIAGFQRGLYGPPTAYQYLRRNRNIRHGTEKTLLDKFHEKFAEITIEKFADNAVGFAFGQNRTFIPSRRPNQRAFSTQGFYFSKKMVFGIEGYICRLCMTINPIIFTFSSQSEGFASNCIQTPCLHHYDLPDKTKFDKYLEEKGFAEPLKDWIQNLWSNIPNFKIVSIEVPDPRILNGSGDVIAGVEYRLTLGYCEEGKTGNTTTNFIRINYDDTLVEDIATTLDKYDASSLSCGHVYKTILDTVDRKELKLIRGTELESFLEATKWRTFGFFRSTPRSNGDTRVQGNVYLIALFPVEFFRDRTIRVVSVDRKRTYDKSPRNCGVRKYPPPTSV